MHNEAWTRFFDLRYSTVFSPSKMFISRLRKWQTSCNISVHVQELFGFGKSDFYGRKSSFFCFAIAFSMKERAMAKQKKLDFLP